jgi:hypothetical protein
MANGDVYTGNFVNGKFHGKGKYTFADGTVYEGDFARDRFIRNKKRVVRRFVHRKNYG